MLPTSSSRLINQCSKPPEHKLEDMITTITINCDSFINTIRNLLKKSLTIHAKIMPFLLLSSHLIRPICPTLVSTVMFHAKPKSRDRITTMMDKEEEEMARSLGIGWVAGQIPHLFGIVILTSVCAENNLVKEVPLIL